MNCNQFIYLRKLKYLQTKRELKTMICNQKHIRSLIDFEISKVPIPKKVQKHSITKKLKPETDLIIKVESN
jgi:5,10-methylene-tetrahydrofolate dehydrogenase/methenyl tetrahydrofolate cyclohydrolase